MVAPTTKPAIYLSRYIICHEAEYYQYQHALRAFFQQTQQEAALRDERSACARPCREGIARR